MQCNIRLSLKLHELVCKVLLSRWFLCRYVLSYFLFYQKTDILGIAFP